MIAILIILKIKKTFINVQYFSLTVEIYLFNRILNLIFKTKNYYLIYIIISYASQNHRFKILNFKFLYFMHK